jgi:acetyltransferase-like isoleucine patch superfamily enzyme
MGVSVNLNVRIGSRAMIGNSAVVKADVPANQIVRAGQIWPE